MVSGRQQIGFLWLAGVLAAAQLAKMAVLAPALRQTFQLSVAQAGLLISLLEVGGALFGFAAGLLIGRIGARRFLLTGLAVLALSGAAEAIATGRDMMFVARAVEGLGYVLVVVAAPTLIAATATEQQRGPALALWSTFVPLGVAFGSALTGILTIWFGAEGALILWAMSFAAALGLAVRLPSPVQASAPRLALPAAAAWLSTAAFGVYTTLVCALTALLPIYLVEQRGAALAAASGVAGLVSAAALPGCLVMILIMRQGAIGPKRTLLLSAGFLLASVVPAMAIFGGVGKVSVSTAAILAMATVLFGGLAPPLILARLPHLSGARSGDDPKLAVAQGLLTQFGAGGALVGPPLGGLVVGAWGWPALGVFIASLTIIFLMVLLAAEWRGAQIVTRNDGQDLPNPEAR